MYAGQIVEYTDVNTLFEEQLHPYTEGLLAAIPVLGEVRESLAVIPGSVPNLINLPPGCKFRAALSVRERDVRAVSAAAGGGGAGPQGALLHAAAGDQGRVG